MLVDMKRVKRVGREWESVGYWQSTHARMNGCGKNEIYALLAADGPFGPLQWSEGPLNDPCIQKF